MNNMNNIFGYIYYTITAIHVILFLYLLWLMPKVFGRKKPKSEE